MNEVFIVTVKFAKNKAHNPQNKKTAECPMGPNTLCTDSTGEHHSFLTIGTEASEVRDRWNRLYHVTRVETATWSVR